MIGLVASALELLLGPLDVNQDVAEGPDGVRVAPHHQVGEADVVVGGDLAGCCCCCCFLPPASIEA